MTERPAVLRVELPGVVSWKRPRLARGGVRYPAAYARDRDAWAAVVAHAVASQRWNPPATARYGVTVAVYGGGKRDLDRVCTALLDALQAGGAVRDDCLLDTLSAARLPLPRGARPTTEAEVTALPATSRHSPHPSRPRAAAGRTSGARGHHGRPPPTPRATTARAATVGEEGHADGRRTLRRR